MNTIIGLGIVLEASDKTIGQIENILDLVDSYKTKMEITHPKDGDYHDWITETVDGNIYTTIEKLAYRTSYADIEFKIGNKDVETRMSITNETDALVVRFDIVEEHLLPEKSVEHLEATTQLMTQIFEIIDRNVEYEYLFCDSEAEYLYSKERLLEVGHQPYALFKMNDRNTVYAEWYLDGFTLRGSH